MAYGRLGGVTVVTCRANGSTITVMTTQPLDRGGYTVADLEALDDDGLRYELDDGCLVVSPSEVVRNGSAAVQLALLLSPALGDQWRIVLGTGLVFTDRDYREPDLMVVGREALPKKGAVPADVLLAVEVMSPSSVRRDRLVKPAQYAEAGIPHFWRLEPAAPVLFTYVLDGAAYRETGRYEATVTIDQPVALRFELSQLLD